MGILIIEGVGDMQRDLIWFIKAHSGLNKKNTNIQYIAKVLHRSCLMTVLESVFDRYMSFRFSI